MAQEKMSKEIRVMIHPSLYEEFKEKCGDNYKTISEVTRELILNYTKVPKIEHEKRNENNKTFTG
jgi:hypothetical protein